MAYTKEKKQAVTKGYLDSLQDSHSVVFVRAHGLTVAQATQLRNRVREAGGKYSVIKNTLFRLALTEADMPVPDVLTGQNAVAFCPEDIAPVVKALRDFGNDVEDLEFEVVAGIVDREVLDAAAANALASLPSKDVLFAQVLAGLNAPGTQLVGVMASGIRQVLNVLQARIDQLKENEAAA